VRRLHNGFLIPRPEAVDAAASTSSAELVQSAEEALLETLQLRLITEPLVRRGYFEFVLSRLVRVSRTGEAITLLCSPPLRDIDREAWLSSGRHLFLDLHSLEALLPRTFPTADLASRVAELERRVGLDDLAADTQRIAIAMYDDAGDIAAAAWSRSQLASWTLGEEPESQLAAYADALDVMIETASPHAADVMIVMGRTLGRLGRFSEALTRLDAATRAFDDPGVVARVDAERALVHLELGFTEDALELADRAVRWAELAGSYTVMHKVLRCRAELRALGGNDNGAVRDFRHAAAIAMMSGDPVTMMGLLERVAVLRPSTADDGVELDLDDISAAERRLFGPGANRRWGETF
jgi:tetratricopeptide (TPR) repeat protein